MMWIRKVFIVSIIVSAISSCSSVPDERQLEKARELHLNQQYEESIEVLNKIQASRLDSDKSIECQELMISSHLNMGNIANSDSLISSLIKYYESTKDGDLTKAHIYKAIVRSINKDYAKSNRILDSLSKVETKYSRSISSLLFSNFVEEGRVDLVDSLIISNRGDSTTLAINLCASALRLALKEKNVGSINHYSQSMLDIVQNYNSETTFNSDTAFRIYIDWLREQSLYQQAYNYSLKYFQEKHSRSNLRYFSLIAAQLQLKLGKLDSAYYYATLAQQSNNNYDIILANEILNTIAILGNDTQAALKALENRDEALDVSVRDIDSSIEEAEYKRKLLKSENELLKSQNKNNRLVFVVCITMILLVGTFIYSRIRHSRRLREEERLRDLSKLALAREKEALLREALFRKIDLFKKIPSISDKQEKASSVSKKITLSKDEWEELRSTVNQAYPNFVDYLIEKYPLLSDDDIAFCCFIKINVSMQDLSDIYCVSKSAITKRKYRIKTEKMNINCSDLSLDLYLKSLSHD